MIEEKEDKEDNEDLNIKLSEEDREPFLKRISQLTVHEFMSEVYDVY